jgi:ABC-type branched-subunit amino acid transport system substrate-binding protein
MDRLARQQRYGAGALIAAVSLLAGVMLATLADGEDTVAVGTADSATGGTLGVGTGSADGATTDGPLTQDGATVDGGTVTGDSSGTATGTPTGAASSGATSDGATATASGNSGASARGVTGTSVKIGVAYLDLSALGQFPQFRIVPGDKAVAAIKAGLKKRGEIPVHGRDVELKLVPYNVLNAEDQRAACQRLVKDEKVFAVVGHTVFEAGAECVAKDEKTPIVMPDPVPNAAIQAGAPFYFSLSMSTETMARNLVHYAKSKNLLAGKKLGIYFGDDNGPTTVLARETKAELGKLGFSVAAEQSTPMPSRAVGANPQPGPDDHLAVQRFQQAGVQVAFLFGTHGRFSQAAQQQGYKPQYLNNDMNVGASDTTASAYQPDQYDGAFAITGTRRNEAKLGRLSPKAQQCVDDYAAGSGDRIDVIKRESEWGALAILCDVVYTAVEGLKQAGGNLTHATYVQGLERIRGLQLAMQGITTFAPGRHAGGDGYRSLVWRKATGYQIEAPSDFRPLFVP